MPPWSQIRWNFWNRLRNEDLKEVLIFGQKWPFFVLFVFNFFHRRYQETLHKKLFANNQNYFSCVYWDAKKCQKMAFLTKFSFYRLTSFLNRFQKFQRIWDLRRKDFFHTKLETRFWDLTHPTMLNLVWIIFHSKIDETELKMLSQKLI